MHKDSNAQQLLIQQEVILKPLACIENWVSIYDKGGLHGTTCTLPTQPEYSAQPFQAFAGFLPPGHCCMSELAMLVSKTDLGMSEC